MRAFEGPLHISPRYFAVHLDCQHDGYNSGGHTAANRDQNRLGKVVAGNVHLGCIKIPLRTAALGAESSVVKIFVAQTVQYIALSILELYSTLSGTDSTNGTSQGWEGYRRWSLGLASPERIAS